MPGCTSAHGLLGQVEEQLQPVDRVDLRRARSCGARGRRARPRSAPIRPSNGARMRVRSSSTRAISTRARATASSAAALLELGLGRRRPCASAWRCAGGSPRRARGRPRASASSARCSRVPQREEHLALLRRAPLRRSAMRLEHALDLGADLRPCTPRRAGRGWRPGCAAARGWTVASSTTASRGPSPRARGRAPSPQLRRRRGARSAERGRGRAARAPARRGDRGRRGASRRGYRTAPAAVARARAAVCSRAMRDEPRALPREARATLAAASRRWSRSSAGGASPTPSSTRRANRVGHALARAGRARAATASRCSS